MLTSVCAQEWSIAYYNYEEEVAPQFEQAAVLGEGAYGKVLRCTLRRVDVAIKVETGVPSAHGIESFLQEVNHVSRLQRCENIVQLLGFSHRPEGAICLVYELSNQGCLDDLPNGINFLEALCLFLQYAKGLEHMHSCSVVHGDIKPWNMLLHKYPDGRLKGCLEDLGLAQLVPPGELGVPGFRGTVGFLAPECRGKNGYSGFTGDVYAFGITLGMLAGDIVSADVVSSWCRVFLAASSSSEAHRAASLALERCIMSRFEMPLERECPAFVQRIVALIIQCCNPEPRQRPTAARVVIKLEQAIEHVREDIARH